MLRLAAGVVVWAGGLFTSAALGVLGTWALAVAAIAVAIAAVVLAIVLDDAPAPAAGAGPR